MSVSNILDPNTADQSWKALQVYSVTSTSNVDVGGNLQVAGSSTFNGPVSFMSNGPLNPSADNTDDLGSVATRWRNLYLGTNANIDGSANIAVSANLDALTNQLAFTHNSGNQTIINSAVPAASRTYALPDVGSNGSILVSDSSNNVSLNNITANQIDLTAASNQIVLSSGNDLIINKNALAAPLTYNIPDVGSNGAFVVANSLNDVTLNDVTVNQLNYTTLNPAQFKARTYLYRKDVATALPGAPGEAGQSFDTNVYQDAAADVTNNLGSFTFNNAGQYSVTMSLKALSLGSNLGAAFAINGDADRFGMSLSGSDAAWDGFVTSTAVFNVSAADQLFCLALATASSVGQNVGGVAPNSSYISIVRLA